MKNLPACTTSITGLVQTLVSCLAATVFRLCAGLTLLAIIVAGPPGAAVAKAPTVNFNLIYHAAKIANQAYDGKSKILGEMKGKSAWVATPGNTDVQYFIIYNHSRKLQAISVRGTINKSNWQLDKDRQWVRDKKTGILMHHGFRKAAKAIYRDVRPRLKKGYATYLTGHSLGGAVAAVLGVYLKVDGVKLAGIYTFGQPKFTNAAGAKKYRGLPLLRIIHQNDTVALVPDTDGQSDQKYAHIGPSVNLLKGPYYAYTSSDQTLELTQGSFSKFLTQISIPDHKIKWYLQNLRDKLDGTERVSFKDRNRYIVRHKYGSGTDTTLPKRKYNFNQQN